MKWAGHIALMGRRKTHAELCRETVKKINHLGRPTSKWEDNIRMGERGLDSSGSTCRCGQVAGYCESWGAQKCGEFD